MAHGMRKYLTNVISFQAQRMVVSSAYVGSRLRDHTGVLLRELRAMFFQKKNCILS